MNGHSKSQRSAVRVRIRKAKMLQYTSFSYTQKVKLKKQTDYYCCINYIYIHVFHSHKKTCDFHINVYLQLHTYLYILRFLSSVTNLGLVQYFTDFSFQSGTGTDEK